MSNSSTSRIESIRNSFIRAFGEEPERVISAPGRVNLIGEHTDYNDGYVLPAAIDYSVLAACSRIPGDTIHVHSDNFDSTTSFTLSAIEKDPAHPWCDYVKGVVRMLLDRGIELGGARLVLGGNVPQGAGLSSSAALEVAVAYAFQTMFGFQMSGPDMALLCQAAENKFVGMNCGIMDQFISRLGIKDSALFIDCRSLEYRPVPIPSGAKVVIVDSRKKRGLVDSEYNARRKQCEDAVVMLRRDLPGIRALRDVSLRDFNRLSGSLPADVRRRAEHVIGENERVLQSVEALQSGDLATFGRLMNESHDSLRDLFQVSCRELDIIVEIARSLDGVYGSRMTGAGFGGCTVSLVSDDSVTDFTEAVVGEYKTQTGLNADVYVCTPQAGAGEVMSEEW
jgi:galactokinase